MPLIVPHPSPQGAIRIVAPAAALSEPQRAALTEGLEVMERQGYTVEVDAGVYARKNYFAGEPAIRRRGILAALEAPHVSLLWAARGGYGTAEAVEQLSTEQIQAHPKWLVGFSDLTAAHVLWQQAGFVSLHAAVGTTLTSWSPQARNELFNILRRPEKCEQFFTGRVLAQPENLSSVSGLLWGGNLTVLASLVGTTALPPVAEESTILFLEDTDSSYRNYRCVHQLLQSKALANVVGVLLGQWSAKENSAELTDVSIDPDTQEVADLLAKHGLPVLGGLPIGHAATSRALLLGAQATLDLRGGTAYISMQSSSQHSVDENEPAS